MGAPRFTEAELRRAYKVAAECGATVEIQRGVIRLVPLTDEPLRSLSDDGANAWDRAIEGRP